MPLYEPQCLPRDLDDVAYNDAVADYNHRLWLQDHPLCRVCGDTVCLCDDPGCEYASIIGTTVGGRVACLGPCVATLVAERWTEEMAARADSASVDTGFVNGGNAVDSRVRLPAGAPSGRLPYAERGGAKAAGRVAVEPREGEGASLSGELAVHREAASRGNQASVPEAVEEDETTPYPTIVVDGVAFRNRRL